MVGLEDPKPVGKIYWKSFMAWNAMGCFIPADY
jgi:hypothetical protein